MKRDLIKLAAEILGGGNEDETPEHPLGRSPIHVVYGGADRFSADTSSKFGKLALSSMDKFAPDFIQFAKAMWLKGCDTLPSFPEPAAELEFRLMDDPLRVKSEDPAAWFAWSVYNRTCEKLKTEPIEDFRIDFEDGYGIRSDEEEDAHSLSASTELAKAFREKTITPFCGFRIKSLLSETRNRAIRTLELFITNLLQLLDNQLPANFVVTLPKITKTSEVTALCSVLDELERSSSLKTGALKIEIMIETPESIFLMRDFVRAAGSRCVAAHFGAYDYTSSFGITAVHQHLRHDACNFARNMMQAALTPTGVRLSDSVTTEMPVPIHRGAELSKQQVNENRSAVHKAWRLHFNNVNHSLINGFYQSWDLHPAQLVARYAALYSFFLESYDEQSQRLRSFLDKATRATMSGNQFDDAASAYGLLNYFVRANTCGAMTTDEILQVTGLTKEEWNTGSFDRIMKSRLIS